MNKNISKKKTVAILAILLTGIVIVMEKIANNKKMEELEEKAKELGRKYNKISLRQEKYNSINNDAITMIQDEICSVYEHIEEIANIQGEKDKIIYENEEIQSQKPSIHKQIKEHFDIDDNRR
jgi:hypothetical protein